MALLGPMPRRRYQLVRVPVEDEAVQSVLARLQSTRELLQPKPADDPAQTEVLRGLSDDLDALEASVRDTGVVAYRLEIVRRAVLPYIEAIASRRRRMLHKGVALERFGQLQQLTLALRSGNPEEHPAECLLQCDAVVESIKLEEAQKLLGGWFGSDLKRMLQPTLDRLWQPILVDTARFLRAAGSKLLMLGTVVVLGRTLALLYPLTIMLQSTYTALDKAKLPNQSLTPAAVMKSPQAVLSLVKALAMLVAASKLADLVALYASLGYICLLAGIVGQVLPMHIGTVKAASPVVCTVAGQLCAVLDHATSLEQAALRQFGGGPHAPIPRTGRNEVKDVD